MHPGSPLRSTDPLPCTGHKSRSATVKSLAALARALNVPPLTDSYFTATLPPTLFHEDGSLRRHVSHILFLDHVLIYGLALFVCVCVCVRAVCMCVCLGTMRFLHLSPQACRGSHVESNSVVFEYRPGE